MTRYPNDLALPAQIETAPGTLRPITVAALDERTCELHENLNELNLSASAHLWLGAIGPLTVRPSAESRTRLDFDGAIHPAIVAHFNGRGQS
ncbi:hypothetical protein MTR62_18490 [Novosphingobium sp. 1949]|uniref:Uncharacterized protein n=1 Tax=Novosphingobium organovorum TaxID=2930092 RepID=A0ABT0BHW3_9SPHN|nr:hypothetical protein [Novosphingobium organovorum]MCJ2184661.1 hypothetical protein [Novosphingobium organovorum]